MTTARIVPYRLRFRFVAVTSRERMTFKDTYFLVIERDGRRGVGECALFRGLSCDDRPGYGQKLAEVCRAIVTETALPDLTDWPSIRFGVETALRSLASEDDGFVLFPSPWTRGEAGIRINGLVWMGDAATMKRRVREKLDRGFRCIKLKIGGVDFADETAILASLRREFDPSVLEIRLDANGAFTAENVFERLDALAAYSVHSIEQPVKAGQTALMARVCEESPIDVALDEELIGVNRKDLKRTLLQSIRPRYIILKPALTGGFAASDEWIAAAEAENVGWWATSALESDIGLNAIAQWCFTKHPSMPQGLGTGQLYENNITSPLDQRGDSLMTDPTRRWTLPPEFLR